MAEEKKLLDSSQNPQIAEQTNGQQTHQSQGREAHNPITDKSELQPGPSTTETAGGPSPQIPYHIDELLKGVRATAAQMNDQVDSSQKFTAVVNPTSLGSTGLDSAGQLQAQISLGSGDTSNLECAFFIKNGTCAYGDRCKFHHPIDKAPIIEFNRVGLPLRPAEPECAFYMRNGWCGYGHTCKFDHPKIRVSRALVGPPHMSPTEAMMLNLNLNSYQYIGGPSSNPQAGGMGYGQPGIASPSGPLPLNVAMATDEYAAALAAYQVMYPGYDTGYKPLNIQDLHTVSMMQSSGLMSPALTTGGGPVGRLSGGGRRSDSSRDSSYQDAGRSMLSRGLGAGSGPATMTAPRTLPLGMSQPANVGLSRLETVPRGPLPPGGGPGPLSTSEPTPVMSFDNKGEMSTLNSEEIQKRVQGFHTWKKPAGGQDGVDSGVPPVSEGPQEAEAEGKD